MSEARTAGARSGARPGFALLQAGFRPFFLGAALWAALAIPLWLAALDGAAAPPSLLPPLVWHIHEMVFGFAAAVVAGFLLTAVPGWTGRAPLRGAPLAALVLLWIAGRGAVLWSEALGAPLAAALDLAFPAALAGLLAREILAGRNWRNLAVVAALLLLFAGNLLVHLEALGVAESAALGDRIGLATLFLLIALIGGRIVPSFTRNWLAKRKSAAAPPPAPDALDHAAIGVVALSLAAWAGAPEATATQGLLIAAGAAAALRLARWRGLATLRDPLLLVLHLGYGWLALGLVLLGAAGLGSGLPPSAALHALTVGAVGTMTLAVMTRASLGHSGRALAAGAGTVAIYVLITLAACFRVVAPVTGSAMPLLWLAGGAWSAAYGLFALLYAAALTGPRVD